MASNLEKPGALLKPFASQGDKNTIPVDATGTQAASLQEGFPPITSTPISQGGIPPERKDFNGLGYLLSNLYFYLQNGGQFTFDKDVSDAIGGYPEGAILNFTDTLTGDSYRVRSLIPNNTHNFNINPAYIDDQKWTKALKDEQPGAGNIGDIKYTLVKDVAPFGGAWTDGSTYTSEEFPDTYQMLAQGKLASLSFTDYETQITNNGVCAYFGFDAASQSFKVPTIKNVYIKAGEAIDQSKFLKESLPNITGEIHCGTRDIGGGFTVANGAFQKSEINDNYAVTSKGTKVDDSSWAVTFDGSRSSSAYQDNAKVNPDHIILRAYVVLYIGVQDANEATWVLKEDVANKVNSLGNPSNLTYPTTQAVADAVNQLKNTVDNNIQYVESLPAEPLANVLYCIPETYTYGG